jgi:hypothetical protein
MHEWNMYWLHSLLANILLKCRNDYAGFEVLTAVVMKSSIFWDTTSFCPLKVNGRFGGTYSHHQDKQDPSKKVGSKKNYVLEFYQTTWCYNSKYSEVL